MPTLRAAIYSIPYGVQGFSRFSGRSRLALFWPYFLLCLVVAGMVSDLVVEWVSLLFTPVARDLALSQVLSMQYAAVANLVATLLLLLMAAALMVRRLHDTGRSGLWLLLAVIPSFMRDAILSVTSFLKTESAIFGDVMLTAMYILSTVTLLGALVLFVLLCLPSQPRDNQYGIYEPVDLVDRLWLTRQEVKDRLAERRNFVASEWMP